MDEKSNYKCSCGCSDGPQCDEMAGYTRCMLVGGHVGPHKSYGYLNRTRTYDFEWSSC